MSQEREKFNYDSQQQKTHSSVILLFMTFSLLFPRKFLCVFIFDEEKKLFGAFVAKGKVP